MHVLVFLAVILLSCGVQLLVFKRAGRVWVKWLPAMAAAAGLLLFLIVPSVLGAVLPGGYYTAFVALAFGAGFIGCLLGLALSALTRKHV